jgi:hypothetical protein
MVKEAIMIEFENKSFCFTGTLADLKRTQAERETRARGGMTTSSVNRNLDYLVVGSIPSIGWKHGNYGTKIEVALSLRAEGLDTLRIIHEDDFIDALAHTAPVNIGEIDTQVLVVSYRTLCESLDSIDMSNFNKAIDSFHEEGFHARVSLSDLSMYQGVFGGEAGANLAIDVRLVRQVELTANMSSLITSIEKRFEGVDGIDGRIKWFTKAEGSADFIRLMKEIPSRLRIE